MEPWAIVLITIGSGLAIFIVLFCIKQKRERRRQAERTNNRTQIMLTPVNNQIQQPVNNAPYPQSVHSAPFQQPPFYGQNYAPQQAPNYGIQPNYMPQPGFAGQFQAPPSGQFQTPSSDQFQAPPPPPPYYGPSYIPQGNSNANNYGPPGQNYAAPSAPTH